MMVAKLGVLILFCAAALFPAFRYVKVPQGEESRLFQPAATPSAEYLSTGEKLFQTGVVEFKADRYDKALPFFSKLIKKHGLSPFAEPGAMLLAHCLIRNESYEEARWILRNFPKRYPESKYLVRCDYLSGLLLAQTGDAYGAAGKFVSVYQSSAQSDLARLSASALTLLIKSHMGPDQIMDIAARFESKDEIRGYALSTAGASFFKSGELDRSLSALQQFISGYPNHPLQAETRVLLTRVEALAKNALKVGVLLPRTAENSYLNEVGAAILKGIETAADIQNKQDGLKVILVVRDTRGLAVESYRMARELLDQEKVSVLIGPLSSDELCVVSALSEGRGVPVVSPTASALGIEALGHHVFLMTPPKSAIMQSLLNYTVDSLKIHEYAVLYPNDEYGNVMAQAFRDAVAERGLTLLGYEMYERGEKNFKVMLDRLHSRKTEQFFEEKALIKGEFLGHFDDRKVEVDSLFMADSAVTVGALFMPGYPDEITMLGPQVPFYKLRTQMLGASGWYDRDVLKHAGKFIDGAIVAVDFEEKNKTEGWKSFSERFKSLNGEMPDLKATLGADALSFVLSCTAKSGSGLLERMQKKRDFSGVLGRFVFDEKHHANNNVILLKVDDEDFHRIPSNE